MRTVFRGLGLLVNSHRHCICAGPRAPRAVPRSRVSFGACTCSAAAPGYLALTQGEQLSLRSVGDPVVAAGDARGPSNEGPRASAYGIPGGQTSPGQSLLLVLDRRLGPSTVRGSHPAKKSGPHVQFGARRASSIRRGYAVRRSARWFIHTSSTSARPTRTAQTRGERDDPRARQQTQRWDLCPAAVEARQRPGVDHGRRRKTGEAFEPVLRDEERALDVYHHPFAYAAQRRDGNETSAAPLAVGRADG